MSREHLHTLVALVENRPGVLNRVVSKVRQRGFNIESLAVGHSEEPGLSRMTFTVDASTVDTEQVVKQVEKLIDVVHIEDITNKERDMLARELLMVKVKCKAETRSELLNLVNVYRASVIDITATSMIIEAAGDTDKLDSLVELLGEFGVIETCRTGQIAMLRGPERVGPDAGHQHVLLPHLAGGRAPGGLF
jgi:acetolactate synthase-1/3 small subunit